MNRDLCAEECPWLPQNTMMGVLLLFLLIFNSGNHLVAMKTLLCITIKIIYQ